MKLYLFDHCPYCVKVRMVANYKNQPLTYVFLQNHDEATPIGLVGKKVVPIVEFDDGKAMNESLDIARHIDGLHKSPVIQPATQAAAISQWLDSARTLINLLYWPRCVQLPLPEYEQAEARAYFTDKKQQALGVSFEQALANSAQYIEQLSALLAQAPVLPSHGDLTWDDVELLPFLRNLTCVEGLQWPAPLRDYVNARTAQLQINVYW